MMKLIKYLVPMTVIFLSCHASKQGTLASNKKAEKQAAEDSAARQQNPAAGQPLKFVRPVLDKE